MFEKKASCTTVSLQERPVLNTEFIRPYRKRFGNAAVLNQNSYASIKNLLASSCPATIAWFVITIIIYSVYVHSGRTFAHVGNEVFKALPSLANLNASAAVILVSVVIWILASQQYAVPNIPSAGIGHAMSAAHVADALPAIAPARFDVAIAQVSCPLNYLITAFADTPPISSELFSFLKPQYRKPAVALSGQIHKFECHSDILPAGGL